MGAAHFSTKSGTTQQLTWHNILEDLGLLQVTLYLVVILPPGMEYINL